MDLSSNIWHLTETPYWASSKRYCQSCKPYLPLKFPYVDSVCFPYFRGAPLSTVFLAGLDVMGLPKEQRHSGAKPFDLF